MAKLSERFKNAWNVFVNADKLAGKTIEAGSSMPPSRVRWRRGGERTIISSIQNRMAVDCASVTIKHVKLDDNGRFTEEVKDPLNECLTLEANSDQTSRSFMQDIYESMFNEGCVALVPTVTDDDPTLTDSFGICEMRVGRITEWFPSKVRVNVYDDAVGTRKDIIVPKSYAAIVQNPWYSVMNEPNSVMQRLIRKLNLLDAIDEQSGSGKLDLIIQLPYVIRSEARKQQAEDRRKDIEAQLSGSKYGIAYTDGTEHITQLNRPVENNLMKQIEFLTSMLYSQLGITEEIMNGTANEATMLNYNNRTIEPIVSAVVDEMKRKFLTKTARTQKHSIMFFRDPFKLVPVSQLAEIADKFTRNEIMTSNEIRQITGMMPSKDPNADVLRNKNLNQQAGSETPPATGEVAQNGDGEVVGGLLDDLESQINDIVDNYLSGGN